MGIFGRDALNSYRGIHHGLSCIETNSNHGGRIDGIADLSLIHCFRFRLGKRFRL